MEYAIISILLGLLIVTFLELRKEKENTIKEMLKADRLADKLEIQGVFLKDQRELIKKLNQENTLSKASLRQTERLLENKTLHYKLGVFYDTQNDTVVLIDNLQKIGDL